MSASASLASMTNKTLSAAARLQRDWAELQAAPLVGVAAEPVDGGRNMLEWHATLVAPGEGGPVPELAGVAFHLVLEFPQAYPARPPKVSMPVPLRAHPNVVRGAGGAWTVCLDMLESATAPIHANASFYTGWSSAYSVRSILMQLQALLWDSHLASASSLVDKDARSQDLLADAAKARAFQCAACKHSGARPAPAVHLTPEAVAKAADVYARTQARAAREAGGNDESDARESPLGVPRDVLAQLSAVRRVLHEARAPKPALVKADAEGWRTVGRARTAEAKGAKRARRDSAHGSDASGDEEETEVFGEAPLVLGGSGKPQDTVAAAVVLAKVDAKAAPARRVLTLAEIAAVRHVVPSRLAPEQRARLAKAAAATAAAGGKAKAGAIAKPLAAPKAKSTAATPPLSWTNAGTLGHLPAELLLAVLTSDALDLGDVLRAGASCRWLHAVASAADVWRCFAGRRARGGGHMHSGAAGDWRTAYLLEAHGAARDLACWYSRVQHAEAVLGFPVEATWNPRTRSLDYALAHGHLLSRDAFRIAGVRETPTDHRAFAHWLPAYLTEEHFARALPELKRSIADLAAKKGEMGRAFEPNMVLDVFPKLINTVAVLLADKGVHASEAAVEAFAQVHRVFVACLHKWPRLQDKVEARIARFMAHESNRTKDVEPSLGEFIALLSVSEKYNWTDVADAVLCENGDRSILWLGKANPTLVPQLNNVAPHSVTKPNQKLLDAAFESTAVSRRLISFHVLFLGYLHGKGAERRTVTEMALAADVLYGRPRARDVAALQKGIRDILERTPHWGSAFERLGVKSLTQLGTTRWLLGCVKRSLQKGYHRRNTDFNQVQSRGVSQILKRGESYKVGPGMRRVRVDETWRFDTAHTIFLDASCAIVSQSGAVLEHIAYNHTRSAIGGGAVRHSGDVVRDKEGTHVITVELDKLPSNVASLAFFMSGWTTPLKEVRDSNLQLLDVTNAAAGIDPAAVAAGTPGSDAGTGEELCSFSLNGKDTGSHTAVLMGLLKRCKRGEHDAWELEAVGKCGPGRVGSDSQMFSILREHAAPRA